MATQITTLKYVITISGWDLLNLYRDRITPEQKIKLEAGETLSESEVIKIVGHNEWDYVDA